MIHARLQKSQLQAEEGLESLSLPSDLVFLLLHFLSRFCKVDTFNFVPLSIDMQIHTIHIIFFHHLIKYLLNTGSEPDLHRPSR